MCCILGCCCIVCYLSNKNDRPRPRQPIATNHRYVPRVIEEYELHPRPHQPTNHQHVPQVSEEYELHPAVNEQPVHRDAVLTSPDAPPSYEAATAMPSAPPLSLTQVNRCILNV